MGSPAGARPRSRPAARRRRSAARSRSSTSRLRTIMPRTGRQLRRLDAGTAHQGRGCHLGQPAYLGSGLRRELR